MSAFNLVGELLAGLENPASGTFFFFPDTTSSATKPVPTIKWFDGTTFTFAVDGLVVHLAGTETITGAKSFSLPVVAQAFSATGLTGATAGARFVGGTASGAPVSGTFQIGDLVIDQTGTTWICIGAGTPGTWVQGLALASSGTPPDITSGTGGTRGTAITAAHSDHTHGLTFTTVNAVLATANASINVNGQVVSNAGTPVSATDLATKSYVDAAAAGLSIKDSVVVAATSALPANNYLNGSSGVGATIAIIATGVLTIDGHAVALNERVLVNAEALPAHDGIFLCTTAGAIGVAAVLTRATDADTPAKLAGAFTFVEDGTNNGGSGWVLPLDAGSISIGTTGLAFTQFSGAGEVIPGNALTKSGNTLNVTTSPATNPTVVGTARQVGTAAGSGLSGGGALSGDLALAVVVDNTTLDLNGSNQVEVKALGIGTSQLAANGVTNAKIAQAPANTVLANITGVTANIANITIAALRSALNQPINLVTDYGLKVDHRVVFDGATTGGTGVITSPANANFVAGDVGKRITLAGAGASGAMYVGSISSINSTTSVNVSPNTTTTVSTKGLQVHTDDLAAWNTFVSDVNAITSGTVDVYMPKFGTNRSGVSGDINAFNKSIKMTGCGSSYNHDVGDYTKGEGSCIAYVGASSATTGTFDAVLTFKPALGATSQALTAITLQDFWIDCRNGDQNQALYGFRFLSCHQLLVDRIFVMDPKAAAAIMGVVAPGTAIGGGGSIGEEKGCDRFEIHQFVSRALENQSSPAAATLTPTTTTSAITLSTSGQSLVLAAANGLDPVGYVWVMTTIGKLVLVNYSSGGGTTTITGCTVELADTIESPITVSGSNVVQAVPANAAGVIMDGDLTANVNLGSFFQCEFLSGITWGPATMDFRNSDSVVCEQIVINQPNGSTGNTNDGLINRIRKPGYRFHGSNVNVGLAARNNVIIDGDPGPGGINAMGLLNTAATKQAFPSGPNYYDRLQLANAAGLPVKEQFAAFYWNNNGGLRPGDSGAASVAAQSVAAATTALLTGSVLELGPQGFQAGLHIRFIVAAHPTTGAAVASSWLIKVGTTQVPGTDTTIATGTLTGTAATTGGVITIDWKTRTIGASATTFASYSTVCGPATGLANALAVTQQPATTNFSTVTSGILYAYLVLTTGAGQVISVDDITAQVVKGGN